MASVADGCGARRPGRRPRDLWQPPLLGEKPRAAGIDRGPACHECRRARRQSGAAWRLWRHLLVDGHRPAWFQLVSIPGEAPRHRQPGNLRACRTGVGRAMPDRLATAGPASHRRAGCHDLLPGLALDPDGARQIHPVLDAPSGPDDNGIRPPANPRPTRGCSRTRWSTPPS